MKMWIKCEKVIKYQTFQKKYKLIGILCFRYNVKKYKKFDELTKISKKCEKMLKNRNFRKRCYFIEKLRVGENIINLL